MPLKPKRPRIEPATPPYDSATQDVLDLLGPPISLFRVFARNPARAHGLAGWGRYYLSPRLSLSLRHRELVIDRTVALCGADYEWGVHVAAYADRVGLDEDQVTSLARGRATDACWDPVDSAVIAAVDELHQTYDLGDETWETLVGHLGEDGVMDLLLLAGWYHAIAFTVRALRLPLEYGTIGLTADPA
jgi:alkylhydroperoxidase family enzyme